MKSFSRVLFLLSIVFAASFSACSDSTSDSVLDIKQLQKAAEQGDAEAQNNLGRCYVKGDGVEKDEKEAVKWFRKAAEQGNAVAQCKLGLCYHNGEGVKQDDAKAAEWLRKAADQGFELAKEYLEKLEN